MRIWAHGIMWSSVLALAIGCGKGDGKGETKDDPAADPGKTEEEKQNEEQEKKAGELSENITKPSGALALALGSLESIMATDISASMVGAGGAGLTDDEGGFKEADCSIHADPLWRETDDANFKGDSGGEEGGPSRLREDHPRYALQSLYCQMQKDTGSPDSFLGAVSQNKLMFCILKDLTFDGQEKEKDIAKAEFTACLDAQGASEQDKKEMTEGMTDVMKAKIKASAPSALGKAGEWDASIELNVDMGGQPQVLNILFKDNADTFAMSVHNNGGHPTPTDGYVVQIGKKSGEVRFESKMQRIRDTDGKGGNVGWTRHARVYVKGTMDANLKFSDVTDVQGAYSDISVNGGQNMGADANAPLQMGKYWTAVGNDKTGFLTNMYRLKCEGDGQSAYTCQDANKAASWVGYNEQGIGACNGAAGAEGDKCSGSDLKVAADADTAFVMEGKHASFEKTEDWIAKLAVPAYTSVTTAISQ